MKEKDYKKIKQELEQQIEINHKQILENDEKTRMAKVNQFHYKAQITFVFSALSYIVLLVLCLGLKNTFLKIPTEFITLGMIGTSLGIGEIVRKIFYKSNRVKERFFTFSKAKTEAQKLEEEIQYKIELEKLKSKNCSLHQTIKLLDTNSQIFNSLSNQYSIHAKTTSYNKEDSQKKIDELSAMLKEAYQKLDTVTTQEVLHEKTWNARDKMDNLLNTLISSLAGAGFLTIFLGMTTVALQTNLPSFFTQIMVITSPIIGAVGTFIYMQKRKKDTMKAFHNLNTKLNEFALLQNTNDYVEEKNAIKTKKDSIIKQITSLHLKIEEEKRALESYETPEKQATQTLNLHQAFTYDIEEETLEKGKTFILRRNPVNH